MLQRKAILTKFPLSARKSLYNEMIIVCAVSYIKLHYYIYSRVNQSFYEKDTFCFYSFFYILKEFCCFRSILYKVGCVSSGKRIAYPYFQNGGELSVFL